MNLSLVRVGSVLLLVFGVGSPCCGDDDYSLFFTISNVVSPDHPSATVTLWGAFDPQWYAFCQSHTEVVTALDHGALSAPKIDKIKALFCDPGDVSPDGDSVTGIYLVQYQFLLGQYANTANPIDLWSATWTTDDFTPRKVPVWTQSTDYWVYVDPGGEALDFYSPDFSEGHSFIQVVPAPSGAAILACAGLWRNRRRR